jgi:copper(I)-binding protein
MEPHETPEIAMRKIRRWLHALTGGAWLLAAVAHAAITVNAPWVQPTPERAATEAYLVLTSTEGATLKEVKSILATSVVIRVAGSGPRPLPKLVLPAGVPVVLAPNGVHLVLRGLAHPLNIGDRVPLLLTFELASGARQEMAVNAEVRARSPLEDVRRARP